MFYEGCEKKVEIIINSKQFSLLEDVETRFWHTLVHYCDADIISVINNSDITAFLLSESSLFICNDRLLLLTCGNTRLINGVEYFIKTYGKEVIIQLNYHRKSEYLPRLQLSSFNDDVQLLSQYLKGSVIQTSHAEYQTLAHNKDNAQHQFFHYHNKEDNGLYGVNSTLCSNELVAHHFTEYASTTLCSNKITTDNIRQFLQLKPSLTGFIFDDHIFSPYGYSINAIKGKRYFTIHITPQSDCSYIGIQSNSSLVDIVPSILSSLKPQSIDLLAINDKNFLTSVAKNMPDNYIKHQPQQQRLDEHQQLSFVQFSTV